MIQLLKAIPDVNAFLALEPEELGATLLFLIRQRESGGLFLPDGYIKELFGRDEEPDKYPRNREDEIGQAYVEAWAWLEAQGLIVPEPGSNRQAGWRRLSRRAHRFENREEFDGFVAAKLLPKEILHPSIADKVWLSFVRGEYDVAVLQAMKQVEISVREACNLGADDVGVPLMRKAFHVENGPLTDHNTVEAEREARQHLFAGAIGSYKNPQSHRHVNLDDPEEAIEIILLASHLLRIVATRKQALLQI